MAADFPPNQQTFNPSTWPIILSIPLREYLNKSERPFIRLWAMCDLTEIILRLGAIVGLSELRAINGKLPDNFRSMIWNIIQRPTMGQWKVIVNTIFEQFPKDNLFRKDFQTIFYHKEFGIITMLDGPEENRGATNSLIKLRNELAHGSGINSSVAAKLLKDWETQFEKILITCSPLLSEWNLLFFTKDKNELKVLCEQSNNLDEIIRKANKALADGNIQYDAIILVREETVRHLWPLALYGPPLTENGQDNSNLSPTPQIYGRHDNQLEYTPIGSDDLWRSVGSDLAREHFRKLLEPNRPISEFKVRDFEKDLQDDARIFVGRKEELERIHKLLSDKNQGILWLTGRPGIGKSFLTALVALNPFPNPRSTETNEQHSVRLRKLLVLAYRFKVGDDRCSSNIFFKFALERLKKWDGLKDFDVPKKDPNNKKDPNKMVSPDVEFRETLNRVNHEAGYQVLLVLDGCDELLQVERHKHFFTKGPINCGEIPGVVWLCSGRPEDALIRLFSSPICTSVFPYDQEYSGVPPMDRADIRQILLNQLAGPLRKRLLSRDQESNDTQEVENDFISKVNAKSEGLPLYVRFVLGDIARKGTITNFDPKDLPNSLLDFYQNLISQAGIGVWQQFTSPIIALLTLAKEPLDIDIILVFLRERTLLTGDPNKDRKNVNHALNAVASLLQIKSTYENEEGYALNHKTLRDYLKRPEMEDLIAPARNSLNASCAKLELLNSAARGYLVRQSTKHLLEGECWDKLYSLFTNLIFLEAKNEAGLLSELNKDIRDAVSEWPTDTSNRFEQKQILELLRKELIRNQHFIDRHNDPKDYPQGLFQCLWNNLSSICSAYKFDLVATSGNSPKSPNTPVHSTPAGLKSMLDEWYTIQKTRNTPWFRVSESKHTLPVAIMREHTDFICTADAWENPKNPSEIWIVSGGRDCTVILWNPNTGDVKSHLSHENIVLHVKFLDDGRIVSGDADGIIFIWNPNDSGENPKELARFDNDEFVSSLEILPDESFLVAGSDGSLMHCDLKLEKHFKIEKYHDEMIIFLKLLPNKYVVSGSIDGQIKLWKSTDESEEIYHCKKEITVYELQPYTNVLIIGCIDNSVMIIDLSSKEKNLLFEGLFDEPEYSINCFSFIKNENSKLLISFKKNGIMNDYDEDDIGGFVIIFNMLTKKSYCLFDYYLPVSSIIILPDYNFLLLGQEDTYLTSLNPKNLKKTKNQLKNLKRPDKGLCLKEKYLILWGQLDNTISMHPIKDILSEKFNGTTDGISEFKLMPDGCILEATLEGKATIINPSLLTRQVVFDFSNDPNFVLNGFSHLNNGKFVFFGKTIVTWNPSTNDVKTVKKFQKEVTCLTEIDSGEIVLGFKNGSLEIFNLKTNKNRLLQSKGHKGFIENVLSFSKNKIATSGGEDGKVILWNLKNDTNETLFKSEYGLIHINKLSEKKLLTWESHILIDDDNIDLQESFESSREIKIWNTDTGFLEQSIKEETETETQETEIRFLNILPNETIVFGNTDSCKLNFICKNSKYSSEFNSAPLKMVPLENSMLLIAFADHEVQLITDSEIEGSSKIACYYPISEVAHMISTKDSSQFWIVNEHDDVVSFKLEGGRL